MLNVEIAPDLFPSFFAVLSPNSPSMPPNTQLQSVAAFTPQPSSMTVVLGSRIEPWLTESLRRIKPNEPLNSVAEHQTCLSKVLSSPNTIWILASLMREGSKSESDPEFYLVDIEANIVLVDIPCDEVVFKLTSNTTDALIKYYQDVYCVDAEEKEQHKRLREDFIEAINRYTFRMPAVVLDGLEKDSAGEPLCGQSRNVKTRILNLMERLSPSPSKEVEPISESPSLSTAASSADLYPKPPINKVVGWQPDLDPTQALSPSQVNCDPFSISFYGVPPISAFPPIPSQPASTASDFGHIPAAPEYESAPDSTHLDPTPRGVSESPHHSRLFAAPTCNLGGQPWLADRFAESTRHDGFVRDRFAGDHHISGRQSGISVHSHSESFNNSHTSSGIDGFSSRGIPRAIGNQRTSVYMQRTSPGLSKLFKKVQDMERRLAKLEASTSYTRHKPNCRHDWGCPSQVEWAALKSRIVHLETKIGIKTRTCSRTQQGMDVASRASRKRRKVEQQQPDSPSEDEISDDY
ncbi:uncharacterized protein PgNI_12247 [Pyricularia grisea]|uniref:Uncharacterized protein n=1 Tax=Pyricularia grisea TaxID=148305 RepID=A0A6P8AMU0_PYRGI|nr:uncharacterized protein PgNI_12247 [Pyricularia grisea]TLD03365.1 hypothetical protein PgNI_12247 [Pyricularia grisea]